MIGMPHEKKRQIVMWASRCCSSLLDTLNRACKMAIPGRYAFVNMLDEACAAIAQYQESRPAQAQSRPVFRLDYGHVQHGIATPNSAAIQL
jgi:hypothetical protein